jgi:hypothetical protein
MSQILAARDDVPASLVKARNAYLNDDKTTAISEIKLTLEEQRNNKAISQNAFDLLKQIITEGSFGKPPETELPPQISNLDIRVSREINSRGDISFSLALKCNLNDSAEILESKVAYFTGASLLDSKSDLGAIELETDETGTSYKIIRRELKTPPPEGPIEILLTFSNGRHWKGWAPLTNIVASKSPEILIPQPNETIESRTPSFVWRDFTSPEFKANERKSFWASISRTSPWTDVVVKDSWATDMHPTLTVPAENALENGPYRFKITYVETSNFGAIRLKRMSASRLDFRIKQ